MSKKIVDLMENGSDKLLQKWYHPSQINRQGFTNPKRGSDEES